MIERTDLLDPTPDTTADRDFFGQPRVLANLFGVELWERFSFYGMQGLLAIYLYYSVVEGGLGLSTSVAAGIVGAYGGGVYLSAILGAWLSDRVFGAERTLFYSAIVVMTGHVALALLPGLQGLGVGLVLIAFGSGGVKATATALVGSLYAEGDARRDAGFSIFYMGINLGGLTGPLLTGLLQKSYGFHVGFGLAAVGMAFGLAQYARGRSRLPEETHHVPNPLPIAERRRYVTAAVVAVAVVAVLSMLGVITLARLADIMVGVILVAALGYFVVILTDRHISDVERSRVWSFVPMFVVSAVFWSLYQQQFTVVAIYSDQRLDRDLFGWEMPVSWVQSINPVFIILLAPLFALMWTRWGQRQPSTPVKFAAGTIVMGLAFLPFLLVPAGENSAPLLAIVGILFLFTIAELLLSPVGLSLSTKLAPRRFSSQMVALYFLSVALGTTMSGKLATYYDPNDETGYFLFLGLVAIGVGVVLVAFNRPIRRLMAGVH